MEDGSRTSRPGAMRVALLEGVVALEAGAIASAAFSAEPPWPDSVLYIGLARNLASGIGYHDTIRMDEVLPPAGHPLLLAAGNLLHLPLNAIGHITLAAAFALLFAAYYRLTRSIVAAAALVALLVYFVPESFSLGGIEQSVLFASALVIVSATVALTTASPRIAAVMGLLLAASQIIRPLLTPALLLATLVAGACLVVRRLRAQAAIRHAAMYLGTFAAGLASVMLLSQGLYADQRLTSGTVSGIGFYCSYNKYLNLTESYSSARWSQLPEPLRSEALAPLDLRGRRWTERDRELRQLALEYIKQHPGRTWEIFRWRFSRYSFATEWVTQRRLWQLFLVMTTALLVGSVILRRVDYLVVSLLAGGVGVYMIIVQAVYSYVGEPRHLMAMIPFLFQPAALAGAALTGLLRRHRRALER